MRVWSIEFARIRESRGSSKPIPQSAHISKTSTWVSGCRFGWCTRPCFLIAGKFPGRHGAERSALVDVEVGQTRRDGQGGQKGEAGDQVQPAPERKRLLAGNRGGR